MAVVTGNLSDAGLGHLAGLEPEISFVLNEPQITGSSVFATRPNKVTPDSGGNFTITLAPTTSMSGDAHYTMHVRWLEPGTPSSGGHSPVDVHIRTPLHVPTTGGAIGDLIGGVTNLSMVYLSLTEPTRARPFMLWWKTDPADPTNINGLNTGKIYQWGKI